MHSLLFSHHMCHELVTGYSDISKCHCFAYIYERGDLPRICLGAGYAKLAGVGMFKGNRQCLGS